MKIIKLYKTTKFIIKAYIEDLKLLSINFKLNKNEKNILKIINKKGYYVWENFYDDLKCKNLRNEIDNLIKKGDFIKQYNNSDFRIYGGNFLSKKIDFFNKNKSLNNLACSFLKMKTKALFTLSARLQHTESNLGSGQGWHRDTYRPYQFKAMLYLCKVTDENGPFQILEGTNKKSSLIYNYIKHNIDFDKSRFSEEEINKMSLNKKIKTFIASEGDLILFNSYCIHRGSPTKKGNRYALTNYYFPENFITKNKEILISKFKLPIK